MKEKRSYIFYGSFEEAFEDIDDETELIVRRAISQYGLYKVEPELTGVASALFKLIAPVIDASQKRRKNGESGGRPKKEEETNGHENEKPMVTKEETNGFKDVKPDKEVDVEVDVETEMDVDEEVENESSSTSSSSFLVLSSVTSDIHKKPTAKQIIKVLSDSGFSEYMAETAGNKFWNYFNGKNWSFLKYNSWTNKLEEWIPTEHILKDEYEKILDARIEAQKEEKENQRYWEEHNRKYWDNDDDRYNLNKSPEEFADYIYGDRHYYGDDELCRRMHDFFIPEELEQMYKDGAVEMGDPDRYVIGLYERGKCKELIIHFMKRHVRSRGIVPFVWKSREDELEERNQKNTQLMYEEPEYAELPFS